MFKLVPANLVIHSKVPSAMVAIILQALSGIPLFLWHGILCDRMEQGRNVNAIIKRGQNTGGDKSNSCLMKH